MLSICLLLLSRISAKTVLQQQAVRSYVFSNPQLVSQIKIFYGEELYDHIPIDCEVAIPFIKSEINYQDQHSEKYHIK